MQVRYSRGKKKSGLIEIKTKGWESIDPLSVETIWQTLWFDAALTKLKEHRVIQKVNNEKYIRMLGNLFEEARVALKGLRKATEGKKPKTYIQ